MAIDVALPPPMQREAMLRFLPTFFSAYIKLTIIREPVKPMGAMVRPVEAGKLAFNDAWRALAPASDRRAVRSPQ